MIRNIHDVLGFDKVINLKLIMVILQKERRINPKETYSEKQLKTEK